MNSDFAVPGLMPVTSPIFDSLPAFSHLKPYSVSNTFWEGIAEIGPCTDNGLQRPLPVSIGWLEFTPRFRPDFPPKVLSSAQGAVLIVNPDMWCFEVPEQPLDLSSGMWNWILRAEDLGGAIVTLQAGDILIKP